MLLIVRHVFIRKRMFRRNEVDVIKLIATTEAAAASSHVNSTIYKQRVFYKRGTNRIPKTAGLGPNTVYSHVHESETCNALLDTALETLCWAFHLPGLKDSF